MPNQTIVNFIKQHVKQGYSIEQIKDYLKKYGFKEKEMEEAIDFYYQEQNKHKKANKEAKKSGTSGQASPQLITYVKDNLAKGYDEQQIRNYLLQYGYDHSTVEQAMHAAQPHHIKHTLEIHPATVMHILLIVAVIGGLVLGGYFLFGISDSTPELLDYSIQVDNTDVNPGEMLYFVNKITNMGDKRRYDIFIEFKIINKDTLDEITSWSKTFAIDVVVDKPESVLIPANTKPGKYLLHGEVHYGDMKNKASNSFKILSTGSQPSCFDNIKNQDELGIDCGGTCNTCETCYDGIQNQNEEGTDCGGICNTCETCFDNIKNQDETGIDCGGVCNIPCSGEDSEDDNDYKKDYDSDVDEDYSYTPSVYDGGKANIVEQIIEAKELAKTNPGNALGICNNLVVKSSTDSCITSVAKISNQSSYCYQINNDKKLDACYMYFVTNYNDYTLCDSIVNDLYKSSCDNLKKLANLQKNYGEKTEPGTQQGSGSQVVLPGDIKPTSSPDPVGVPSSSGDLFNNVKVQQIDATSYVITWTTGTSEKSVVKYGTKPHLLKKTEFDFTSTKNHEVTLSNLDPAKKYYFAMNTVIANNIVESDVYDLSTGNKWIVTSEPVQEPSPLEPTPGPTPSPQPGPEPTPDPTPTQQIQFNSMKAIKVGYGTYKISWTTNFATASILKYGKHPDVLVNVESDAEEKTSHSITISSLELNKKYYYQVAGIVNEIAIGSEVESFDVEI
ncbi:hypothetical protein HOC35_01025 [Candidatus Woesearchaeota archaeon]|jgi:hypothetical protein|nr:hypothetical protein [Candidatus Woesearchaeota archaeon]